MTKTRSQNNDKTKSKRFDPKTSLILIISAAAHPVDLASAHTAKNTRCIDCHSGHWVFGRITAELLGAHNALAFYTKTAVHPAVVTRPVGDDA